MNNYHKYAECNVATDLSNVDFTQVAETNATTVRKSIAGDLFWLHYVAEPSFIEDETVTPTNILNHTEFLEEVEKPAWKPE